MATPKVAAAKPREVVTIHVMTSGDDGTTDVLPSVAEIAALAVLAVEGLPNVDRAHDARVDDVPPGQRPPS